MSFFRWMMGLEPIQDFPAKAVLMCAIPEHGKSTVLQGLIAEDCIKQKESRFSPWPWPCISVPPPVRVYDPKKEMGLISAKTLMASARATGEAYYENLGALFYSTFGDKKLEDFKEFQFYDSASEAADAAMSDMRGVLVIEEILTVEPSEYSSLTKAMAIRRTSTAGNGLTIYMTTQRPKIMPVAARAIPDEIWMGQIVEPDDVAALKPIIGPEKAAQLPTLARGKWVIHRQGKGADVAPG